MLLSACTGNNQGGEKIVSDVKLSETEFTAPASGTDFTVYYSILNAVEGATLSLAASDEWITVSGEVEGVIGISIAENKDVKEGREGEVVVRYAEVEKSIVIRQEGFAGLTQSELVGKWTAVGDRWNLDEKSACYLMSEDGSDFAYDEDGNYIYITVREYCQQYADDWNAAHPNSEIKATAEMMAEKLYEDFGATGVFTIDEDNMLFEWSNGVIVVTFVNGTYKYDMAKGIMTVEDRAIESDPRNLQVKVFVDEDGYTCFEWPEYYLFNMTSFDGSKEYWIYASTIFFCEKRKEE